MPGSGAGEPAVGTGVTPDNWQLPPLNRWAFWHVRDFLPTAAISRGDGPARELPAATGLPEIGDVPVTRVDGSSSNVAAVLDDTYTDAYLVLQDGAVVTEWYGPEGAADLTHALLSVSKSVVGCVAAVLGDMGLLDVEQSITEYVPELAGSGYAGATVRHLLDMRSGVLFREDYLDPAAEVRTLARSFGWSTADAVLEDGAPRGLYSYLTTLEAEAPHGERFLYRSSETDVLGWVCERAGGKPMNSLISALIWQPLGAEFPAEIMHDVTGSVVHDGGLCATLRDVARFGQLLLDAGSVPDRQGGSCVVIGPRWFRHAWAVDAEARVLFDASPAESSMPGGWYRSQFWFRPGPYGDVLLCLGIYGQMVYVSRRTRTVCVKFSSWPEPQIPTYLQDTIRAFDAISGALTGRPPLKGRHRLPGVVAGLSRHGGTGRTGS